MRTYFVISLSLLIVILSFSFCLAGSNQPYIVPVGGIDDLNVGYFLPLGSDPNNGRIYRSNNSPVYVVLYNIGDGNHVLAFSDQPNTNIYSNAYNKITGGSGTVSQPILSQQYKGYYYRSGATYETYDDSFVLYLDDAESVTDVIDFIDSSVFSTAFDLTYLVNGSVSWLSTFAQAVKNNALLLFFVVFIFVGIGIGLLNRFRRG